MKYLFIGAHPDDIEFSCGGTILRLLKEGHEVCLLVMTSGSNSLKGKKQQRRVEQEMAFAYSGAQEMILLDYEDGAVSVTADSVRQISRILEDMKPDFVITHYPDDSHQDHRNVAAIVKSATRRKYSLLYYNSYSSVNFKASLFVDITNYVKGKEELLRAFESQIIKYEERGIDFIELSILINKLNGYEGNASYAETFAVDTYMI